MRASSFARNQVGASGGAIFSDGGTLTVDQSTFLANTAGINGGAVWVESNTTLITNSTFSDNSATNGGGLATLAANTTVTHTTFSGNGATTGSDIRRSSGSLALRNSILANSAAGANCVGNLTTNTNNLIEDGTCSPALSGDPLLAALGDYGGTTQTFALRPGSPAIDAGSSAACLATDQRGLSRTVGTSCDSGAVEFQGYTLTISGGNSQTTATDSAFATPLAVALTSIDTNETANAGNSVSFTAPASGASLNPASLTATTDASGVASAAVAANSIAGSYVVTATATGVAVPAMFNLTNCGNAITVTNANDSGSGSLRQAIADSCSGATLTFDNDYTIMLQTHLEISKGMRIDGTTHAITIDGTLNTGTSLDGGIFLVGAPDPVTLSNLRMTGGSGNNGGGIYNSSGTLKITNSTISDNGASNSGGGIFSSGTLMLVNTTISGNDAANDGGGVYNSIRATITNSIISGNRAASDGGGFYNGIGSGTLINSTISGNSAPNAGGVFNEGGTLTAANSIVWGNSSHIGGGGTINVSYSLVEGGYTGTSNLSGDPLFVSPVASTAAPTTSGDYDLQTDSPALNVGDTAALPADTYDLDSDSDTAEAIPYDRSGNARVANGTVDMGAYERQANLPPTLDQPAAMTLLEDAGAQTVSLTGISSGGGSQTLSIVAVSSNPTLIPNPSVSYTSPNTTGGLQFTPAANANGTATITVTVQDSGGTNGGGMDILTRSFSVTVTPVNDAPSFTVGANQTVQASAGAATVNGWASGFNPGPADEAGQSLLGYTIVSNSAAALFSVAPAIDATGTLTYTPTPGARGTATISVVVRDSGGTANGGVDTSATHTFTITIGGSYQIYLPLVQGA